MIVLPELANGSRECAPDDRLGANPESRVVISGFRVCACGASRNDGGSNALTRH
jgi:hypothetical protein